MARNPPVDIQEIAGAPISAVNPIAVRLTDGSAYYTASGGSGGALSTSAKGTTPAGSPTAVSVDANTTALHTSVTNFPASQAISAVSLPLPAGAATETTLAAVNTKLGGTLAVNVGLTDTQLRASAVPVSIAASVAVTGPLTDTQIRATALPVSIASMPSTPVTGTFWQTTQPVSLAVAPTTAVTGTFWQATQPISAVTLPLPTGAAADATLTGGTMQTKITNGTVTAAVLPPNDSQAAQNAIAVNATGMMYNGATYDRMRGDSTNGLRVQQSPAIQQVSLLTTANTAGTLTIAASGAGLFHYITSIEITVVNPTITAVAAAATLLSFTTTNLGSMAWNAGTLLAAGTEKLITRQNFSPSLKAAVANTATTFVMPAAGAGTQVRINVTYYTGP